MVKVVGSGPKGTCFCALSGLQGSSKLTPESKRTSRQLRVGLQAVTVNKPASTTNRPGASARKARKNVMNGFVTKKSAIRVDPDLGLHLALNFTDNAFLSPSRPSLNAQRAK
jgi:hypothetical protein